MLLWQFIPILNVLLLYYLYYSHHSSSFSLFEGPSNPAIKDRHKLLIYPKFEIEIIFIILFLKAKCSKKTVYLLDLLYYSIGF